MDRAGTLKPGKQVNHPGMIGAGNLSRKSRKMGFLWCFLWIDKFSGPLSHWLPAKNRYTMARTHLLGLTTNT